MTAASPVFPAQDFLCHLAEDGRQLKDAGGWSNDTDSRDHDPMVIGAVDDADQPVAHVLYFPKAICIEFGHTCPIEKVLVHSHPPANVLASGHCDTTSHNSVVNFRARSNFRFRAASCLEKGHAQ